MLIRSLAGGASVGLVRGRAPAVVQRAPKQQLRSVKAMAGDEVAAARANAQWVKSALLCTMHRLDQMQTDCLLRSQPVPSEDPCLRAYLPGCAHRVGLHTSCSFLLHCTCAHHVLATARGRTLRDCGNTGKVEVATPPQHPFPDAHLQHACSLF